VHSKPKLPCFRPGDNVSYTQNWPYEPLVGNRPTGDSVMWTGVSILMLLAGICAMVWWYASESEKETLPKLPVADSLGEGQATPSQRATLKYFWVASALILVQILMGVVTAHYGVEGGHLYFSGAPTVALAFGSVFSALEVVPLAMVAYPAVDDLRRGKLTVWAERYKWPIYFFVAVAF
jgi:nitric oxide reductase large subunit